MVRENLVIMDVVTTKFGQRKQVQLSKPLAIFLLLLFVGCLVATGLLVYNLTSACSHRPQVRPQKQLCSTRAAAVITTESIEVPTQTESTVIPTTTEEFIVDASPDLDVRLPQSVIPHSYKLKLIPFLQERNFTSHGEVKILVNVTSTTNNITLHADELFIDNVSVTDLSDNTISIRDVRGENKKQFLVIDLDEDVVAGNQYYVHIVFKGVLNNLLQGCYRSSYKENNETRWILATQFQPTDARTCFPCFDEPGMKARFQINIARLKNMTSISNMRIVNSNTTSNLPDYVWDEYEESVPMSTYLIAFVVSDFEKISKGKVSIWARRSALSQAHYALEVGPKILEYYEKYFDIKYPLPKLDMVAIPDFSAGAMENWGLVTYRESDLLYEKGVSSRSSLHRIAHVVAHELAHQWFGNLVTPTWWTDLWLNEGFATFMEYLGSYSVDPDWKDLDLIVVSGVQAAFGLDALSTSHQISIKVNNPDEVNDIFDRISYCKGASIIRMMQNFISYEIFHIAINKYLSSRMYSNAEQDDLWKVLTTVGHENNALDINITIKEIMDTWTLQVGYPVVTARVIDDAIVLTQERFFLNRENKLDNSLWWIPITYADSKGRLKGDIWMRKEIEITMPYADLDADGWFILNVNQAGYYRVNYDIENWQKIAKQLSTKEGLKAFNPKNRAQLLDDALNLAFAGYISYDIALNVTTYLINEREYVPWRTGLNSLDYLYDMFLRTAHFDKYKLYILHIIRDFYTELGFKESADDEHLSVLSRTDIVGKACLLGLRDCVINAVQKFQNWKNTANPDMDNDISPDLREIVYCTAISDGGQEEWDFAWQRYLNTNVANEKEILLAALGCSKHTWILSRYLEWATTENSGIRKHDFVIVFASVAANPVGKDLTYRFLKTQWNRIRYYLGSSSSFLVSLVRTATAHFNTEEEVNDFKSFLSRKRDEFGVAFRAAQQSIEQAEANVKWMKTNFDTIVKWLENVKR